MDSVGMDDDRLALDAVGFGVPFDRHFGIPPKGQSGSNLTHFGTNSEKMWHSEMFLYATYGC
jgi:hypothetical protein